MQRQRLGASQAVGGCLFLHFSLLKLIVPPASPSLTHSSQLRNGNRSPQGMKTSWFSARMETLNSLSTLVPPHVLFVPYKKKRPFLTSPEGSLALEWARSELMPFHFYGAAACRPMSTPCREDNTPTTTPFR